MNIPHLSRRSFLKAGAACAILSSGRSIIATPQQPDDIEKQIEMLSQNLLQLINEEREVEKAPLLKLDDFATRVAMAHARDMAIENFASHWGSDGLKPYHRYSFAGGYHATQENVSAADNTWSMRLADLKQDTSYLHVRLYQETPPNDGHRRAILAPQHTHVGLGISVEKLRLRMVELFVSKYVELKPITRTAKPKTKLTLSGRLLKSDYSLNTIEVFYEPLPAAPSLAWLRETRSYSLPNVSEVLRPIPPPPYTYADRESGVIQVGIAGDFETPISLFKETPGIYTVVCWVRRNRREKPFPATELCIRAE